MRGGNYILPKPDLKGEFKLARQLDQFHAQARQHYANFLVKVGHIDEALNEIN